MPDHTDVVARVKAELVARGVNLSGPEGAFAITSRVAWALRAEGAGLLDKPAGNHWNGYATDIVCYPTGEIVDVLGDGGGANAPQWMTGDVVEPSRYRPAFDPGDATPAPAPGPTPQPTPAPAPDSPAEERFLAGLELLVSAIDDLAGVVANLTARFDDAAKNGVRVHL